MTADELPRRIGRYEVLSELGHGSMGRVYLAHDPNTDRKVAVKRLAPASAASPEEETTSRARFLLEARAAARLQHPGIVVVHDADTDAESGRPYFAMEWVDGPSLGARLKQRGPLPWSAAARIAARVAAALEHAHQRGVVHRDVKPSNILLGADGSVKVSDFGIAKFATESHTLAGHVLGTPNYMSPEQLRGEAVDGRSDVFALGAVLYQMLTGEPPFRGDSLAAITYKAVHVDPRPPSFARRDLPEALERVVLRALAKAPESRFATAGELAAALEEVCGEPAAPSEPAPVALPPESAASPRVASTAGRRPVALASALGLVVVLLLGLAWRLDRGGEAPSTSTESSFHVTPPMRSAPPAEPAAPVAAPRPAAPAPAAAATLQIVHTNRLRGGRITVWVDGERAWTSFLNAPRNVLDRVGGQEVGTALSVPAGTRRIEVRVGHSGARIDSSGVVSGRFEPGQRRRLRVVLRPYVPKLGLDWES